MIAIDTNIVVRLVTNDDPQQARRAATLFESRSVFIPKTVLLESEWVLRHAYAVPRNAISIALRGVLGLPGTSVEDPAALALALEWFDGGMDFADALHLASSQQVDVFATFDTKLIARARGLGPVVVVAPGENQ